MSGGAALTRDPAKELAGRLSVEASARRVRRYRYVEERLMRTMAGWIALTPELAVKLVLGRQVWDCAQHADLWGRRLPELRAPAQVSEPANPGLVTFMDVLESPESWEQTGERLAGVYRVLKPRLIDAYQAHLEVANPIYEPPTRRILERCLTDERRHVQEGQAALALLEAGRSVAVGTWVARLESLLGEAGGVTGERGTPEGSR